MEGLCEEAAEMVEEEGDGSVRDAGIIAPAQRVEHYEVAAYRSTIAFARLMGHDDVVALLAGDAGRTEDGRRAVD